jgi:hypothetical protein
MRDPIPQLRNLNIDCRCIPHYQLFLWSRSRKQIAYRIPLRRPLRDFGATQHDAELDGKLMKSAALSLFSV